LRTIRSSAARATILNPLIDAVEQSIAPSPATATQNLGLPAIVQHAYVTGRSKPASACSATGERDRRGRDLVRLTMRLEDAS
jgi:hypothetical protein